MRPCYCRWRIIQLKNGRSKTPASRIFNVYRKGQAAALAAACSGDTRLPITRTAHKNPFPLRCPSPALPRGKGAMHDLFKLKPTGVSTAPLVAAAKAFLDVLTPAQQLRTIYAVDDPEWRRWCNVDNGIYSRQGVSLQEMTEVQKTAARELMRATLSAKGYRCLPCCCFSEQNQRLEASPRFRLGSAFLRAWLGVPHLHRLIHACRCQPFPVRAERHAHNRAGVPLQCECLLTARGVPHLHRLIHACRCQPFPVRAKRHAPRLRPCALST